eukprot:scaffold289397_cov30-Tisochrysis_lutea.AAC.6
MAPAALVSHARPGSRNTSEYPAAFNTNDPLPTNCSGVKSCARNMKATAGLKRLARSTKVWYMDRLGASGLGAKSSTS